MTSQARAAVIIAFGVSIAVSAQSGPPLQFEVASVKPSAPDTQPNFAVRPGARFSATNMPLIGLIALAHNVAHDFQIVGAPDWIRTARYDVDAKAPEGTVMGALATSGPRSPVQQMLASMLEERFSLRTHSEKRDMPAYELRANSADERLGPRLKPSPSDIDCDALRAARKLQRPSSPPPPGEVSACLILIYPGRVVAGTVPLEALASFLTSQVKRMVIDRTPFTGRFDFDLTWVPDDLTTDSFSADQSPRPQGRVAAPTGPSLTTAIQEQLGLRLQSTTAPTDVLVIDSVSQVTPN